MSVDLYAKHPDKRMLACIVCGKVPDHAANDDIQEQSPLFCPYAATQFTSYGHYGSTFWDSFEGEQVVINICDTHLEAAAREQLAFLRQVRSHPTRWREIDPHPHPEVA